MRSFISADFARRQFCSHFGISGAPRDDFAPDLGVQAEVGGRLLVPLRSTRNILDASGNLRRKRVVRAMLDGGVDVPVGIVACRLMNSVSPMS